jgi:pimeloyl-ACP methyl ester carboxylesterase
MKRVLSAIWTASITLLLASVAHASHSSGRISDCHGHKQENSQITRNDGFIDLNGQIHYSTAGVGKPLLFIHDGAISSEVWNAQADYFSACRRVIRYDRRGYGTSPIPSSPFSNIEDLHAVIHATHSEGATLIAGSMGGMLALDYTLQYPKDVEGLVLVGPIVSGLALSDHFNRRMQGLMGPTPAVTIRNFGRDRYLVGPGGASARATLERLMEKSKGALEADPAMFAAAWQATRPALPNLGEIKVPTLILAGEYDIPDVHAHTGAISAGIAGARRIVVSDAGHLVYFEQPDVFNRLVANFLDESF